MAERVDYLVPRSTPTWDELTRVLDGLDHTDWAGYHAACFAARLNHSDDMCVRFAAFVAITGDLDRQETWPARMRQLVVIRDKSAEKNHRSALDNTGQHR